MNWTKISTIAVLNVALILGMIGLFVVGPIAATKAFYTLQSVVQGPGIDSRSLLPNYNEVAWADQYFRDHHTTSARYSDFVVWTSKSLSTKTINIDSFGRRHTEVSAGASSEEVWLFGGSTMFGVGSNDQNTIPSLLASEFDLNTVNYGDGGYIAHQSLNRLVGEYATRPFQSDRPSRTIVFFDGVNDPLFKCRAENVDLVTQRQSQIREALRTNHQIRDVSPFQLLWPAQTLVRKVLAWSSGDGEDLEPDDLYVCDSDAERAEQVARALVADWKAAQAVATVNGDRFVAILQPVLFFSETLTDHLPWSRLDDEYGAQYHAVYPLIRSIAADSGIDFYDLSDIYDRDEYVYIDFAHVSPNGNLYMAEALTVVLS